MDEPGALLLHDDDCGFCSAAVRFVRRHGGGRFFRFIPLDSAEGRSVRERFGADPGVDSIVVVENGRVAVRSEAVLLILRRLEWPWHLLRIGRVVPRRAADAIYDAVARRRGWLSRRMGLRCGVGD